MKKGIGEIGHRLRRLGAKREQRPNTGSARWQWDVGHLSTLLTGSGSRNSREVLICKLPTPIPNSFPTPNCQSPTASSEEVLRSVGLRHFGAVDDQHFDLATLGVELQPQVLTQRRQQRGAV